jgi:plasmid stabilization system protein ParE
LKPLALMISPDALREIRSARLWLAELDPRAEARFARRLEALLTQLCEELPGRIATGRPPQLDQKASMGMVRPVFQERFYSSAKKPPRRSSASTWRVFYALLDADRDSQPDTLEVLHLFHAGAGQPWDRIEDIETDDDDSPQEEGSDLPQEIG